MGVVAVISAAASGYFFQRHMNRILQKYAFMIKSEALMLRERGAELKDLSQDISSYAKSGNGLQQASYQGKTLQQYAQEVQKQGEELEQYAGKVLTAIQAEAPENALATTADLQLFAPENLKTIQRQRKKIDELETASLKLRSKIQRMRLELDNCIEQPEMGEGYPPGDYPEYKPGSNRNNR
jgi:hypothetical protein